MLKGFKDFIMRGNLVELAVAFIMAAAFAQVVLTFTAWLMSLIPAGATNFGQKPFGLFIAAVIAFLIIAAVVYFAIVVPYQKISARLKKEEPAAVDPDEVIVLKQIRDLLATNGSPTTTGTTTPTPGTTPL
ncbi:MAG TPA: MscL family protein [Nocardioidaceae bacterium]|nr:MscL family protein [Nocardioidaceae bacterium]